MLAKPILDGIRVLDLSRILAGPWATQLLADYGAEVIKVERPGVGDDTRHWGPPFVKTRTGERGDAAYFQSANRNKQSITIDFTRPEGGRIIRDLAARSDVLVENYRLGGLAKYGLDYESLKAISPKLVYCSITGFGQTGPYADRAGYDYLIQAMGGLMSITGQPDGMPGAEPMKTGVAVADLFTGLYASNAILAALFQVQKSGQGQHVDVSLLDCQVAMLANQATNYLVSGRAPARLGNAHPNIVPYQVFATADGHFVLAVGNDTQFARFCAVIGHRGLSDDPRFGTNAKRVENRSVLIDILHPLLREQTTAFWIAALDGEDIPCGPINNIDEIFGDAHVEARNMIVDLPVSDGVSRTVAHPVKFSQTPCVYHAAPPQLGSATAHVLREILGMDGHRIEKFAEEGVI